MDTSATPINGKEAKELILIQVKKLLDASAGFNLGNSYHRLNIKGNIALSAYPADTPTPTKEFEFNIDSINTIRGENEELFQYVKRLETNREELISHLSKITETLELINPTLSNEFDLSADNSPDKLRIDEGLPIPVVQKIGGRSFETHVDVSKTNKGFQLGKKQ